MSDYFQEMGWTPLGEGETPNHYLHMARLFRDSGMWELLGEDQKLPPPASVVARNNLEVVTISKDNVKCPICMDVFSMGQKVKRLPCQHTFHDRCILPWLEKTNSCPLCRYELPTDDKEYEEYRKEKKRAVEREKDLDALHNSMFS